MNKLILFIIFQLVFLINGKLTPIEESINVFQPTEMVANPLSSSSSLIYDIDSINNGVGGKCEPLNINLLQICKDIGYNETRFPNFMKQKNQQEASIDTQLYLPLVRINCSPVLKLFLCSLYAPPCVRNYSSALKPCREMCEKAKSGCEDFMKRFQLNWPDYIDCWRFPSFNGPEACVTDENYNQLQQQQQQSQLQPVPFQFSSQFPGFNQQQQQLLFNTISNPGFLSNNNNNNIPNSRYYQLLAAAAVAAANLRVKFACPPVLQIQSDSKNTYYLNVNDEIVQNCGMPCDNNLFEKQEITFARSWVLAWSSICFTSTLFTILTFLIETSRFKYPERPIIFLSGCYFIVSLGYLIGSLNNSNSIVCKSLKNGQMINKEFLVQGVEHIPCTLIFMMIYFFGMSSAIWWVILTLTWFLAAGLKWGHEAIENISSYFHLAAWAIPGVKLIAILWLQKVDADILSGACYTGLRNINLMRGFVLVPLFFYLILGGCFLLAGFVSLFRIRMVMKHEGNKTEKLEKFMVRIGVFSILYMVPAIIVICCHFYEQSSYTKWIDYWLKRNFIEFNLPPDYVTTSLYENDRSALIFSLFMVKYAMLLIVGITSGFWIWSHKTISSWRRFFERVFNCFNFLQPKYKNEAAV